MDNRGTSRGIALFPVFFVAQAAALRHILRHAEAGSLHALLAENLLPDPAAGGRLRTRAVAISGSVFHPLEVPSAIEECFDQVLATASPIEDAFEQAFFAMAWTRKPPLPPSGVRRKSCPTPTTASGSPSWRRPNSPACTKATLHATGCVRRNSPRGRGRGVESNPTMPKPHPPNLPT